MAKKTKITVLEAVNTLSNLADLDVKQPENLEWLDPAKIEENQAVIRETFQTVNSYLQHLYQKDRNELSQPQTQKGIQSMIELAGEAVDKVGQYTELFHGAHAQDDSISEFKKLQKFYLLKVFSKVSKEMHEEEWESEAPLLGGEEAQILKDLDQVRQDRDYDLFYVTRDDGIPFFTANLLRHLRLVGNFDETVMAGEEDNLLAKLDIILDRDFNLSAQKIATECDDLMTPFYREALSHKENQVAMYLTSSLMALFLAANPKNLKSNTRGKCVTNYWNDFIRYLRLALQMEKKEKSEFDEVCDQLMHRLCHLLFQKVGAHHDVLQMLRQLVGGSQGSIWSSLAGAQQTIEKELHTLPSGPLMKVLKMFRLQETREGFDPLVQNNAPHQIFTLVAEELHTTVLHLPAPLHQTTLGQGEITPEFKGYLQALKDRKHFYVNLQDCSSWKEKFRCTLLQDELPHLITLAKNTDFYHQIHAYSALEDAAQFCDMCIQQVMGGEPCGFYFPKAHTPKAWIEEMVQLIHSVFFSGQHTLHRKERLDFIEILYFFIILRYLDQEKPDVINFSCKDGLDEGAAEVAIFYGMTRMLSADAPWTTSDYDCLLFSLFLPALLVRHRSIDTATLQRALSALECFESVIKAKRDDVLKGCANMLPDISFKQLKVMEVA